MQWNVNGLEQAQGYTHACAGVSSFIRIVKIDEYNERTTRVADHVIGGAWDHNRLFMKYGLFFMSKMFPYK